MSELRDLYQEVVLDHGKQPRNFRAIASPTGTAEGFNPLCGDQVTIYLDVDGGQVRDVSFLGSGCAISKASASLMTSTLKGKTLEEAKALFERFHALVTKGPESVDLDALGKLAVMSGVWEFPARVKCASLAWHTFNAALEGKAQTTTE
jgi:nitrogen fixation NifU-like protein